ncbi:ribose-5-phosphate isomerase RpiA [Paenibacillus lemnae]|uniref:Ribose-5-phosphate isomerase A n=1 Tax=Paenibacillus lemnae TaxID=1330551 RepID=A0A848MC69_PAELE|nr:ribose-5-phosphate isomerase RpiA [Paenibacillus lemnae]NMO97034.1 ribose-5-phosphate isomerase RpiA [Paenibacillus lemnae]
MNPKQIAAEKAVEYIQDNMIVGLGTGSTAYWAIQSIGARVKAGLRIRAIATSVESQNLAQELGIPLVSFTEIDEIDVTIDGADEADMNLQLIKGGGGALLREKIVAAASRKLIIVVDESKLVQQLGRFDLPVEVVPFGCEMTLRKLDRLGSTVHFRTANGERFLTDNGNYIADCSFGRIDDPGQLQHHLNNIPGVVDHGLFLNMADLVIAGYSDGNVKEFDRFN